MVEELVNILKFGAEPIPIQYDSRYNYEDVRSELPLGRNDETGSHANRRTWTHIRQFVSIDGVMRSGRLR